MLWQMVFTVEFRGVRNRVFCPVFSLEEGHGDLGEAPANLQHHPAPESHALPSPCGSASCRQLDNTVNQRIRNHWVLFFH